MAIINVEVPRFPLVYRELWPWLKVLNGSSWPSWHYGPVIKAKWAIMARNGRC